MGHFLRGIMSGSHAPPDDSRCTRILIRESPFANSFGIFLYIGKEILAYSHTFDKSCSGLSKGFLTLPTSEILCAPLP